MKKMTTALMSVTQTPQRESHMMNKLALAAVLLLAAVAIAPRASADVSFRIGGPGLSIGYDGGFHGAHYYGRGYGYNRGYYGNRRYAPSRYRGYYNAPRQYSRKYYPRRYRSYGHGYGHRRGYYRRY